MWHITLGRRQARSRTECIFVGCRCDEDRLARRFPAEDRIAMTFCAAMDEDEEDEGGGSRKGKGAIE